MKQKLIKNIKSLINMKEAGELMSARQHRSAKAHTLGCIFILMLISIAVIPSSAGKLYIDYLTTSQ